MNIHRLRILSIIEVALVSSLAAAACTRTHSLGAAGTPDGSDVRTSNGDAGDAQPDLPPDVARDLAPDLVADTAPDAVADGPSPDVAQDALVDQTVDVPPAMNCIDNGITYHSGDVVVRPGCQLSCICIDGVVGACTGIPCPVDGSTVVSDPIPFAYIKQSASTNSPEVDVSIDNFGRAERTIVGAPGTMTPLPRSFPAGAPEVTLFLYHLNNVGDLSTVGDPNPIFTESCPKSVSSGTRTVVSRPSGVASGDLQCLLNPSADALALAHDAAVLLGTGASDSSSDAQLCMTTGGLIANNLCCTGTGDFPSSCPIGACTCAPTNLHAIEACVCPNGGCFVKSVGCVGPSGVCSVGDDQTCNDNPALNAFHGHCMTDGRCSCMTGSTLVVASGKCS